jgi:hypothetical protein
MRIARVFPRRTNATPDDDLAFVGSPGLFPPEVDRVEISVAFTWDLDEAERLAREWERIAPVNIGGPATGDPGGEFTPGKYLRNGYVITSRGCPNKCSYCHAWRRGPFKELEVRDGWIIQDNNLLACSRAHVEKVFDMLRRQHHPASFQGGLEARRLDDWHVDLLTKTRIDQIFFAYDKESDLDPLIIAAGKLREAGILKGDLSKKVRAYVLAGYRDDTLEKAEQRVRRVLKLGIVPFVMLYMDDEGPKKKKARGWGPFQKTWSRPGAIYSKLRDEGAGR